MFRQLARLEQNPSRVFLFHPMDLAHYLETVWALRSQVADRPSPARPLPVMAGARFLHPVPVPTDWHHLIYAYMIESTGIYEILDRVIYECLNGERFGILSPESQMWLRNTEDLFYKDSPSFSIYSLTSDMRPARGAVRQNAHYRMFGMELNQRADSGAGYVKPEASNLSFVDTFEEFLRETWIGIEHERNRIGPNPTDNHAIADLARRLKEMLTDRRQSGSLAREEFFAVATMSWYHLTVEFNAPIVRDLRADGSSPEQRLRKIAEKVNLQAHVNADSFFQLAEPTSRILVAIERQPLDNPLNVPVLYNQGSALRAAVETIVFHWSRAFGTMLKATKVTSSP